MPSEVEEWLDHASHPEQYDSRNVQWISEGAEESPARVFHRRYLSEQLGNLAGKTILDIGCGTGHVFSLFPQAKRYLGIDPSENNIVYARRRYPDIDVRLGGLYELECHQQFDVIIAVMVFEHISDLARAFAKIATLVKPGGKVCIIASDFTYWRTPRFGYEIDSREVADGEVVVRLKRDFGVLYDITRTKDRFVQTAEAQGLILENSVPQIPDDAFIAARPKYEAFRGKAIGQVYLFRKG